MLSEFAQSCALLEGSCVLGDGKELAKTGVMTASLAAQQLAANLSGVQVLDLVVTDGGDGTDSDHADWANATITC